MPNQRVVVLTDEQIKTLLSPLPVEGPRRAAQIKLENALRHPEGITDNLLKLARVGAQDEWQRIGNDSNSASYGRAGDCGEAALRAALFPGGDEQ
jgi:hypothetical protein